MRAERGWGWVVQAEVSWGMLRFKRTPHREYIHSHILSLGKTLVCNAVARLPKVFFFFFK